MSGLARTVTRPVLAAAGLGYVCLLTLLLVLAHLSPVIVLALTVGTVALAVIALRPYLGLHAFIMLLFVENTVASREGVTVMKVVGLIIFCGWLLSTGVRRRSPIQFDWITIAIFAFLIWCAITLVYAMNVELGTTRMLSYVQLAAASLMFASVVDDPRKLRGIFLSLVIWSTLAAFVAIVGYYLRLTPYAVGFTGNRNLLATYINIGVVCAYLLYQSSDVRAVRMLLAISLPILFLGLALTFSRTGLIVFGMSVVLVWYRVARERKVGILIGSALVLCIITFLLPGDFFERAQSIVPAITSQRETFGIRVRVWKLGMRMVEDRPLFGVGPGNFVVGVHRYGQGEMLSSGLTAHNTYIGVAAETGLVGLAVFGFLQWVALRQARRAVRAGRGSREQDLAHLAVMAEISLFVVLASGLSRSVENLKVLWLLIGACGALGHFARRQRGAFRVSEGREAAAAAPALSPGGVG